MSWDGYVIRVDLNEQDPTRMDYHSVQILLKMNVSDTPEGTGADVGLTFSEFNMERFSDVIENLHTGDHIKFNATMITLGDAFHLHHLRGWGIQKLPGHKDVYAHAHRMGRYKVRYQHDEDNLKEKQKLMDHLLTHDELDKKDEVVNEIKGFSEKMEKVDKEQEKEEKAEEK